jgi:hypothetical protein
MDENGIGSKGFPLLAVPALSPPVQHNQRLDDLSRVTTSASRTFSAEWSRTLSWRGSYKLFDSLEIAPEEAEATSRTAHVMST